MDAALKKGDLKFRLDGYKLKGSWVLVRTRGYGGTGAGAGPQLAAHQAPRRLGRRPSTSPTFAPHSVKTPDADLADILAADNPDIWQSHAPAKGGDTGAMFRKIIEKALEIKAGNASSSRSQEHEEHEGHEGHEASGSRRTAARPREVRTSKKTASSAKKTAAKKR